MKDQSISDLKNKIQVGKVRDSHGLKGELFIMTTLDQTPPWVNQIDAFTLYYQSPTEKGEHQEKTQRFTVKKTRPHKKGFIVKAEELSSRNESDLYIGASFFIDQRYLESQKGEKLYLQEIKGCEVISEQKTVGTIISFGTNNAQDLLIVKGESKTFEIPFVQDFIEKIDLENKKIYLKLPSGLIDLDDNESPDDKDD